MIPIPFPEAGPMSNTRSRIGERNRTGQFATPGPLAEEILRYCWQRWQPQPRPVHFLEPCVGSGSFYAALLRVFPNELVVRASGYELDPAHADTATALWQEAGLGVTQGDFLQLLPPRKK
jgi:adenine-specific DNA-methyltransferase